MRVIAIAVFSIGIGAPVFADTPLSCYPTLNLGTNLGARSILHCDVTSDFAAVEDYEINRGNCFGPRERVAAFNQKILFSDIRKLGQMTQNTKFWIRNQFDNIRTIVSGKSERYKGYEKDDRFVETADVDVLAILDQVLEAAVDSQGNRFSSYLTIQRDQFTLATIDVVENNLFIPVLGSYVFGESFEVPSECDILEVKFMVSGEEFVYKSY